jgi:hypothetical protein
MTLASPQGAHGTWRLAALHTFCLPRNRAVKWVGWLVSCVWGPGLYHSHPAGWGQCPSLLSVLRTSSHIPGAPFQKLLLLSVATVSSEPGILALMLAQENTKQCLVLIGPFLLPALPHDSVGVFLTSDSSTSSCLTNPSPHSFACSRAPWLLILPPSPITSCSHCFLTLSVNIFGLCLWSALPINLCCYLNSSQGFSGHWAVVS